MSSEQLVNMNSNINNTSIQRCENCELWRQPCDNCELSKLMIDLENLIPNAVNNVTEIESILLKIGEIRNLSKESLLGLFAFVVLNSTGDDIPNLFGITQDIVLELLEDNFIPEKVEECVICYEVKEKDKFARLNCEHIFCGDCVVKTIQIKNEQNEQNKQVNNHIKCSLCRESVSVISVIDDKIIYNQLKETLVNMI
jgi:hypothetical protein